MGMDINIGNYVEKIKEGVLSRFIVDADLSEHVGIDIGTYSVKMVKLDMQKGKIRLVNCGMTLIKDNDVSAAVRDLLQITGLNTNVVNIGLSGKGVVLRDILFPKMPLNELRQSIGTEADKYIPFPIEEMLMDCCILKELPSENKMFILIAAAKKSIIQNKISLLSRLNLEPRVIDINSIALVNGFNELRLSSGSKEGSEQETRHRVIGILDIGAGISSLNILEDNLLKLSRYIYIGGNEFTKKIAYALNSDFDYAEKSKCNPSNGDWIKNLESCDLLLNNLTHELRISFDYYETENNISIGKLYLSGGGAYLKGLDEALGKSLGIETEIWDPTLYLEIDSKLDIAELKAWPSKLAVAIGLALR
jgi:type IV pilus assembly protein PilM